MVGISEYGILANTRASSITLANNQGTAQLSTAKVAHGSDKASLNREVRADFQRALTEAFGLNIATRLNFDASSSRALSAKVVRATLQSAQREVSAELKRNIDNLLAHFSQRIMGDAYPKLKSVNINIRGLKDYAHNLIKAEGKGGLAELSQAKIGELCDILAQKCNKEDKPQGVELLNTPRARYNSEDLKLKPGAHIGLFEFVQTKGAGVEPGFDGKKAWLPCHDIDLLRDGTKLNREAGELVNKVITNQNIGRSVEQRRELSQDIQQLKRDLIALQSRLNLPHNLSAEQSRELLTAALADKELRGKIIGLIKNTDPYFSTIEHVKMDYAESDISMGKVRVPKARSKGFFHRLFTAKTKSEANMAAIKETLATDLMHAMGVNAQKAKLVPASYDDGSLKLMISSEHMQAVHNDHEVRFETLKGQIVDGVLVEYTDAAMLGFEGKKIDDLKDKVKSDAVIEGWGRNKILMLMLADRDAIGSRGDNKGRLGNEFAAIDPGHSLENYMALRNVNSDFSFTQPKTLIKSMYFKNFTVFDDSTYKEKMEGVKQLAKMRAEGKDTAVFDSYINFFEGEVTKTDKPELKKEFSSYVSKLEELRESFIARRDYLLDEVFAERLPFADDEPYVLGALDMLEKLTSPVRQSSKNGIVPLRHLQIDDPSKRTAWHISREGDGYVFSAHGSQEMFNKVTAHLAEHGARVLNARLEGEQMILQINAQQAAAFCEALSEDKVRATQGI